MEILSNNSNSLLTRILYYDRRMLNDDVVDRAIKELKSVVFTAFERASGRESLVTQVDELIKVIRDEFGVASLTGSDELLADRSTRGLTNTILNRKGFCVELSILLLVIAEAVKIPLYAMIFPMKHMLVGYESNGDSHYVETTKGFKIEDSSYILKLNKIFSKCTIVSGMKCVENDEIVGIYLNILGHMSFRKRRFEDAKYYFQEETKITPQFPRAHYSLGHALYKQKNYESAIQEMLREIEIDPDFIHAHLYLSYLYLLLDTKDKAQIHLETTINKFSNLQM